MQKNILTIQDISCVGRCSTTIALPILSAAGINTSIIPTAILSTHAGFKGFTYRDLTEDILPIKKHFNSLNLKFDALYSGFLGSYEQIEILKILFKELKKDDGLILVDPVMADHGKLYSVYDENMINGMKELCSYSNIITPNLTEAAFLLGEDFIGENYNKEYIERILKDLTKLGPKKVVITGVSFAEDKLGAMCYDLDKNQFFYCYNDKENGNFHGTGDIFASSLLSAIMNDFTFKESVQIAIDFTALSIKKSIDLGVERRFGVMFEKAIPSLIKSLYLE